MQISPAAPGIAVEKLCGTPASLFVKVTVTVAPDGAVTADRSNANPLAETLIATGPGAAAVGVGGALVGVGLGGALVGVAVAVGGAASVGVGVGPAGEGVGETAAAGETAGVGDGDGAGESVGAAVPVGDASGVRAVAPPPSLPPQAARDTQASVRASPRRTSRFIGNYYADNHQADRHES